MASRTQLIRPICGPKLSTHYQHHHHPLHFASYKISKLSYSACSCTNSSSYPNPPPTADSYTPVNSINSNASAESFVHFSDLAYCLRYRDPSAYARSSRSESKHVSQSSDKTMTTSSSSTQETAISTSCSSQETLDSPNKPGNVRKNRHEMERAWQGGVTESYASDLSRKSKTNNLALLFPGTGSQYVGMGAFLLHSFPAATQAWQEAEDALGTFESWRKSLGLEQEESMQQFELSKWPSWQKERHKGDLRKVVFGGPQDELMRSSNAQPAILISSIVFLRALEIDLGVPITKYSSFFGGHSAGEYSAITAGNAISFADAVRLTRLHGLLTSRTMQLSSLHPHMDRTAPAENRAQMSALIINPGHTHEEIVDVVTKAQQEDRGPGFYVEVASFNSSSQVVLSGSAAGVLYASGLLQQYGIAARAADLPVAAPFHCSFMEPAALGMKLALDRGVKVKDSEKPIVSGVNARLITKADEIKSHLTKQISTPVKWSSALDTLRANGVSHMVFCGPGKALANLARREIDRGYWKHRDGEDNIDVTTLATEEDFLAAAEKLRSENSNNNNNNNNNN